MSDDKGSILDKIIATQQLSHRDNFKPQETLEHVLQLLTERERQVLTRRFGLTGQPIETLETIGKTLQVTRERIRQIERLAVTKLKEGPKAQAIVQPLKQVVVEVIEAEGGVVSQPRLLRLLHELGANVPEQVLRFFLDEVLTDVVATLGGELAQYHPGWRLRSASLEVLDKLILQAHDLVTARGTPLPEEELGRQLVSAGLVSPLEQPLVDARVALGLLELSLTVSRNTFGEWGLVHWETISPKRMNDKIYLILKKHGKPLHFRDIVRLINDQHFDHKQAYAPTVHNELILDKKFVLVGRGIYGLTEWGFKPGVVADVVAEVLKERGPLTRDDIVAVVLKQRLVKKGTIYLALTNRARFQRLPDGRYSLIQAPA